MKSKTKKNSLSVFFKLLIIIVICILIYLISNKYFQKEKFKNSTEVIETISMESDSDSNTDNYILSKDIIFREKQIKEWETLAINFYETNYGYKPTYAECYYNENGNLIINLYDIFNDHRSSCEWYEIDKNTGVTTNMFLEEVNLTTTSIK